MRKLSNTRRKKSQSILEVANNNIIKTFTEFMGLNYNVMDKEGKFIVLNSVMLEHTKNHVKASEIDPKAWADCVEVMRTGERKVIEEYYDKTVYLSLKQPLMSKDGRCDHILVVSIDITAQKEAEIMKRRFIDSIHHDIKTPFVGLHMLSGSMAKHESDEKRREHWQIVNLCAKRLIDYLSRILDVVSAKEHRHHEDSYFNLKTSVENVTEMLMPLITEKGLRLEINCPDEFVQSNKMNFEQICVNLLSNAVKFTKEGKITINAELNKNRLKLSITDTGIGIAKKHQEHIFDQFFRVIPSYHEPEFRGCGLGLHLAKTLVDKLHGTINFKSALNKGSTFNVCIPLH